VTAIFEWAWRTPSAFAGLRCGWSSTGGELDKGQPAQILRRFGTRGEPADAKRIAPHDAWQVRAVVAPPTMHKGRRPSTDQERSKMMSMPRVGQPRGIWGADDHGRCRRRRRYPQASPGRTTRRDVHRWPPASASPRITSEEEGHQRCPNVRRAHGSLESAWEHSASDRGGHFG
jgi:hypothetical protein